MLHYYDQYGHRQSGLKLEMCVGLTWTIFSRSFWGGGWPSTWRLIAASLTALIGDSERGRRRVSHYGDWL